GLVLASTYRFAHLNVRAYEVLTHKAPVGAYRAPGAPQAFFALESHLDRLARRLGLDPIELRLKNASREGDEMANGQPWPRIGLVECLERVRQHPFWRQRQAGPGEGYGVAAGGWLGGMEPAAAACRLNGDGTFTLQVGAVDLTGTHTTLAMIAAEVLGVDPDRIRIQSGDTENAPFAGTSAGSKVIYTVGRAVQAAAEDARQQLLELAAGHLETAVADLEIRGDEVAVRGAPARSVSIRELARLTMRYGSGYAPVYGRGRSAIDRRSPAFAVQVVKVRVDAGTGRVEPLACLAVQDVGRALNPAEVYGQIHGGVVQGLGRALFEQLVYDEYGTLANASLMDYGLPVAADLPPIEVELVEVPSPHGPFGAKGVGEPPVVPTAAAVANAVADATGVRVSELPITPEAFWRANRDQDG
ncbi:MAG TPA: molybdopterin cofactor-binding domain-containing protein, partial [Bacillota bacterium]